jgi:hypothetical protein
MTKFLVAKPFFCSCAEPKLFVRRLNYGMGWQQMFKTGKGQKGARGQVHQAFL